MYYLHHFDLRRASFINQLQSSTSLESPISSQC